MKKIGLIAFALLISACSMLGLPYIYYSYNLVSASVDASIDQNKHKKCFIITDKDTKSIATKNNINQIKSAFAIDGYTFVTTEKQANCLFYITYGVHTTREIVSDPVYGNVGYDTTSTKYNSYTNAFETSYNYQQGIVGYAPRTLTTNKNYLVISARKKDNEEIWQTTVVIPHKTLDYMFPVLVNLANHFHGRTYSSRNYRIDNIFIEKIREGRLGELKYPDLD